MEGNKGEDYIQKSKTIFTLLNQFRQNPRLLAKKLEILRTYLDTETNVLSEPNKIQIQMVEGDDVIKEAISFLKSLPTIEPLEWDNNLAQSAMEHVNDIGPQGLLIYQSSDGTEPEDRISKYGIFTESLGENIDFGPNDALGVIISLTLDDGESQRPHRENLFKGDYHKIGIACGPHKTEFQLCVMDFAYDFSPLDDDDNEGNDGQNMLAELGKPLMNNDRVVNISMHDNENNEGMNIGQGGKSKSKGNNSNIFSNAPINNNAIPPMNNKAILMSKNDMLNNSNMANSNTNHINEYSQQSPLVKLSLENDDFIKEKEAYKQSQMSLNNNNEFNSMTTKINNTFPLLRLKCKKVEKITKITYCYKDGSTSEVVQTQCHTFNV